MVAEDALRDLIALNAVVAKSAKDADGIDVFEPTPNG